MAAENAVYWVDIVGRRLRRYRLASEEFQSWALPEMVGFVAERRAETRLVIGLSSGVYALQIDPWRLERLVDPEPGRDDHRINDATVDVDGRLWIGTMTPDGDQPDGGLYRVSEDGRCDQSDAGYFIPNGPTFNREGSILYHADSARRVIYRFDVENGELFNRRVHLSFTEPDWGLPDGMTIDSEGNLWVAHWDGGRLSRFDPDGRLRMTIRLPVSRVTSCAFVGVNLERMVVTTARLGCSDQPLAGALFEVETDARGVPIPPFSG